MFVSKVLSHWSLFLRGRLVECCGGVFSGGGGKNAKGIHALGEVGDAFLHHLVGGVVDEDIDAAHFGKGPLDDFFAVFLGGNVGGVEIAFSTVLLNLLLGG